MSGIAFDLFPGGRRKAISLSYDDGRIEDRRLVELLNRHGLKGSFHLNSGTLGLDKRVAPGEVADLYRGHEVSVHTVTHPSLHLVPREEVAREILDDRRRLEDLVGYPVRGMSYPNGAYSDAVVAALPLLGIEYARTTRKADSFQLLRETDFLRWHPACHDREGAARAEAFLALPARYGLQHLFVWGHSYEFATDADWQRIEAFCALVANRSEVWYATCIEVVDYVSALRSVRVSADGRLVYNPSSQPVWLTERPTGAPRCVDPGTILRLG